MRTCRTCGRDIHRGATQQPNKDSVRCLVCLVARSLASWTWKAKR